MRFDYVRAKPCPHSAQREEEINMNKPKVIFLCTGNSARSQMAEGLLRALAGEHFDVFSAGTEPKGRILPEVQQVMLEVGIPMTGQFSKSVTEYLGKEVFAYVITVCADAEDNCPTVFLSMGIHEHWPFDDPAKFTGDDEGRLALTRRVRDQIEDRLRVWLSLQKITPKEYRQM
jgi:arsenate reductase (thioredoxin)